MKKHLLTAATTILCTFSAYSAYAVDLDDDIKPDEAEHITIENKAGTTTQSAEVENEFPEEAAAIREALDRHLAHANNHDIDGYLNDFIPERLHYREETIEFAQRAMALKDLKLTIKSIEFQKLNRTTATVHTRQISSYIDENGLKSVDDAIISYRWEKDANDQIWKISFTERKRLNAE